MIVAASGATSLLIGLIILTFGLILLVAVELAADRMDLKKRRERAKTAYTEVSVALADLSLTGLLEIQEEKYPEDTLDRASSFLRRVTYQVNRGRLSFFEAPEEWERRGRLSFKAPEGWERVEQARSLLRPAYTSVMRLTVDDASEFTPREQDHVSAVVGFVRAVDRRNDEGWWTFSIPVL